jgi:hypothetical protein
MISKTLLLFLLLLLSSCHFKMHFRLVRSMLQLFPFREALSQKVRNCLAGREDESGICRFNQRENEIDLMAEKMRLAE